MGRGRHFRDLAGDLAAARGTFRGGTPFLSLCAWHIRATMNEDELHNLLAHIRAGDEQYEERVFDGFVDRLIQLARSRLSPSLARRVDPEDVVQSAFRTFFRNARAGRYELRQSRDLWRLLAAVTINKVRRHVEHHTAQCRTVAAEKSWGGGDDSGPSGPQALARDPSPEQAAALADEVAQMMNGLTPVYRKILQLRLQGQSAEETAREAKCAERTVHRAMEIARRRLQQQLRECVEG